MPIIGTRGSLSSGGFGEFRRATVAFPAYLISAGAGTGSETLYKANSLSTAFTVIASGGGAALRNKRFGIVFARGNIIFSTAGRSTDGGVTFTALGAANVTQNDPSAGYPIASGLNGSFAYNPTTNLLAIPYTFKRDSKSSGTQTGLLFYSAVTGNFVTNAAGFQAFTDGFNGAREVIYSSAHSRFYAFSMNNGNILCSQFSGSGVWIQDSSIGSNTNFFAIDPSGFPIVINQGFLLRYTNADLSSPTNLGAASIGGASNRTGFTYLPINQKYAVLSQSGGTLFFSYSPVANPTNFTTTSISSGFSINQFVTANIFEDTNGTIYATYSFRYSSGKDSSYTTLTYTSTNGGASFGSYGSYIGFAKNLL